MENGTIDESGIIVTAIVDVAGKRSSVGEGVVAGIRLDVKNHFAGVEGDGVVGMSGEVLKKTVDLSLSAKGGLGL